MPQQSLFEETNVVRLTIDVILKPNGTGSIKVDHRNAFDAIVAHGHRSWAVPRDFLGLADVLHALGNHWLYGPSSDLPWTVRSLVNQHIPPLPAVGRVEALRDSL
jgi:hypothetical protein